MEGNSGLVVSGQAVLGVGNVDVLTRGAAFVAAQGKKDITKKGKVAALLEQSAAVKALAVIAQSKDPNERIKAPAALVAVNKATAAYDKAKKEEAAAIRGLRGSIDSFAGTLSGDTEAAFNEKRAALTESQTNVDAALPKTDAAFDEYLETIEALQAADRNPATTVADGQILEDAVVKASGKYDTSVEELLVAKARAAAAESDINKQVDTAVLKVNNQLASRSAYIDAQAIKDDKKKEKLSVLFERDAVVTAWVRAVQSNDYRDDGDKRKGIDEAKVKVDDANTEYGVALQEESAAIVGLNIAIENLARNLPANCGGRLREKAAALTRGQKVVADASVEKDNAFASYYQAIADLDDAQRRGTTEAELDIKKAALRSAGSRYQAALKDLILDKASTSALEFNVAEEVRTTFTQQLPPLEVGSGLDGGDLALGSGSGNPTNQECKFLEELKSNIQKIDKTIDEFIVNSLTGVLDAMESVDNALDSAGRDTGKFLNNVLSEINKGSKQVIGDDIWPAEDVDFVSKTLSEFVPKTVKLVNEAVLNPIFRIPRDALHKHVDSYPSVPDNGRKID